MGANWSAPVRNLFNRGKVKEEVQQGVEVVVNAAEQGLEKLDEATSGAVTSLADELSNAGVDLGQFKNALVEGLKDDVHKVENEVANAESKTVGTLEGIGQGLKDEFHHVETQTEVKVEKAEEAVKATFAKTEKSAEKAVQKVVEKKEELTVVAKKTEDSVVETVSSLASEMASFGEVSKATEKKVEDLSSKTEDTLSGWTTSLLTKEKQLVDKAEQAVSQKIAEGVEYGEEKASAGVAKVTQGLSSLQESLIDKKEEIVGKVTEDVDKLKKEMNEVTGLSSDLHFLQDTVVASKDIVVDAFHLGRHDKEEKDLTSPPVFQSTQKPIASSSDIEEKSAEISAEQSSKVTNIEEVEMSGGEGKKETSPVKEVGDFLKQEISDASKHIEKEVKQGVSAAASEAQAAKHTIFDSFTDMSSSITNTLHNIESGVGTKVKEAGEFIAGTEEEIDQEMDDKELKTEAVTSLLDKSFLN